MLEFFEDGSQTTPIDVFHHHPQLIAVSADTAGQEVAGDRDERAVYRLSGLGLGLRRKRKVTPKMHQKKKYIVQRGCVTRN